MKVSFRITKRSDKFVFDRHNKGGQTPYRQEGITQLSSQNKIRRT
jgi:hypothetical protein